MKFAVYCIDPENAAYRSSVSALAAEDADWLFLSASSAGRTVKTKTAERIVYFDADALAPAKMRELGEKSGRPWGAIDRTGIVEDPAALFHAGAADYLGPPLCAAGSILTEERARSIGALPQRREGAGACADAESGAAGREAPPFPGWSKLKAETCYPFVFVFAALGDQKGIGARLGERRLDKLRADFSSLMENWAEESGGLLWIKDAASNLLLFPAAEERFKTVPGLLKFQLNRLLVGYEQLRMEHAVSFRFAVHSGEAPWRKPGSTGTVVSEHVNFIYHLGMKAVADGALGVSDNAFPLIPPAFADLFRDGPLFEGRRVKHSKDFA